MSLPEKSTQKSHTNKFSNKQLAAAREFSKITRLILTDAIKAFANYKDSKGQFSTYPEYAYPNITRQIYSALNLNKIQRHALEDGKSVFDIRQLSFIMDVETRIAQIIIKGIEQNIDRNTIKHKIKQICNDAASYFKESLHQKFN